MNTEIKELTQIEKIDKSNINYKYAYNTNNTKFIWLGNWLEKESTIFKNDNRYKKDTYALITQITTISKKKIFNDNIRFYCNKKIMDTVNKEIIDFLTK